MRRPPPPPVQQPPPEKRLGQITDSRGIDDPRIRRAGRITGQRRIPNRARHIETRADPRRTAARLQQNDELRRNQRRLANERVQPRSPANPNERVQPRSPANPTDGTRQHHVNVPWISQFDRRVPGAGNQACYRAVATMARQIGVNVPASTENRIQVATGEDRQGRVTTTPDRVRQAREHIDSELARGRPAVVGVSHKDSNINRDRITDHFVLVTGRGVDAQGRTYYTYHDPATRNANAGANPNNRLYVDPRSGNLYKEGSTTGPVHQRRYEMSMVVRTN